MDIDLKKIIVFLSDRERVVSIVKAVLIAVVLLIVFIGFVANKI